MTYQTLLDAAIEVFGSESEIVGAFEHWEESDSYSYDAWTNPKFYELMVGNTMIKTG